MADEEQANLLREGVEKWNIWRRQQPKSVAINLRRAYLTKLNLRNVDLSQANLMGAQLESSDLTNADLRGANFSNAYLPAATLTGARAASAEFSWAVMRRVNLTNALLNGANLEAADLTDAVLNGAKLGMASFSKATLNRAQLVGADLSKANLSWAVLNSADLGRARLRGAKLRSADFTGARLVEADLVSTRFHNTIMSSADLTKARLRNAVLPETDLAGVNLRGADLGGADLRRTILTGSNLEEANLTGTNLKGAIVDSETVWPQGFDFQRAIEVDCSDEKGTPQRGDDIYSRIHPMPLENDREELASLENLTERDVEWIIQSYTLNGDTEAFHQQQAEMSGNILFSEILTWMEDIFERRIPQDEVKSVLDKILQTEQEELQEDTELWVEIQSLPKDDREYLEKIDRLRRELREWCRSLPSEIVERLLKS